jgi:DNA-binding transcriptional LysR family regulator
MHSLLRDVEYFAAIAKHGQLQLAAAALGLSQPALSMSLRRLELAMNAKLLKRTPKGVELTSVGSALLSRVSSLRLSVDDVMREIADLGEGRAGHLRIGMIESNSNAQVVPSACTALLTEAPSVTLKLATDAHYTLMAALRKGTLDIAVTINREQAPREADMIEARLCDVETAIFASTNHRLAKRRQLTLNDLAQEHWVLPASDIGGVRLLAEAFGSVGLPPPKAVVEASSVITRFHLVATSDLLTFGTKPVSQHTAAHPGIVDLRIKGLPAGRYICATYRKDAYLPPVAFRFIEILKKVAGDMTKKDR